MVHWVNWQHSLSLNHDLICLERIGWREGWRDQQAGYRGGLEIGVGGHGCHVSMCKCVCLRMFVCILKRWNEALQQPWSIRGRERHGSVVTQQYTQRPPKPPPQSFSFFYSTSNQPLYNFFLGGWRYTRKQSLSLRNTGLQNTGYWYWWVYNVLLDSPSFTTNKAILNCCSFHYK